jgi:hypothetical protein
MGVGGVGEGAGVGEGVGEGEGDVAVLLPPLHADVNVRSRTTQPRLNIGIRASEWTELRLNLLPYLGRVVAAAPQKLTLEAS